MRRLPSNIVSQRVFVQETVTVYEESKWAIYAWWLVQATAGGALGAITFSAPLTSPWWLLPSYLVLVLALKRAAVRLAQRLFAGDMWWQVTSIFLTAFLLAQLRLELAKHARIREAYLVRKQLHYVSEKPLYVMGLVFNRRWLDRTAEDLRFTSRLPRAARNPPELYSFTLDRRNRRLGNIIRSLDKSLIYPRARQSN